MQRCPWKSVKFIFGMSRKYDPFPEAVARDRSSKLKAYELVSTFALVSNDRLLRSPEAEQEARADLEEVKALNVSEEEMSSTFTKDGTEQAIFRQFVDAFPGQHRICDGILRMVWMLSSGKRRVPRILLRSI